MECSTPRRARPVRTVRRRSCRLNAATPGDFAKKTLLVTSGSEAVENAVKIARAATGRAGVIAFTGAYHGRTMLTSSMNHKGAPYALGYGPRAGDIYKVAEIILEKDRLS